MFKPIKTVMFATNLSENCRQAFDVAASLATQYQATIVLLHVIEKLPDYVEGRLKGLLGNQQWQEISASHQNDARKSLVGKRSSSDLIRAALDQFCIDAGIDDASCGYVSREIVVMDGEIVEEIINQSRNYKCDIIILGARHGGFIKKDVSIGPTIKAVLRRSKIPVLVVPPDAVEQAA